MLALFDSILVVIELSNETLGVFDFELDLDNADFSEYSLESKLPKNSITAFIF